MAALGILVAALLMVVSILGIVLWCTLWMPSYASFPKTSCGLLVTRRCSESRSGSCIDYLGGRLCEACSPDDDDATWSKEKDYNSNVAKLTNKCNGRSGCQQIEFSLDGFYKLVDYADACVQESDQPSYMLMSRRGWKPGYSRQLASYVEGAPAIPGFDPYPYACSGNEMSEETHTSVDVCATRCTLNEQCKGFDLNTADGTCTLFSAACEPPSSPSNSKLIFYRKNT